MPDEPVKKRLRRAIQAARDVIDSPLGMYRIIEISDPSCPFHLERFRNHQEKGDEVLKVRVCLDRITDHDLRLCRDYQLPRKVYTKIIFCKLPGAKDYELVEI